jgi:hypothetical protein
MLAGRAEIDPRYAAVMRATLAHEGSGEGDGVIHAI